MMISICDTLSDWGVNAFMFSVPSIRMAFIGTGKSSLCSKPNSKSVGRGEETWKEDWWRILQIQMNFAMCHVFLIRIRKAAEHFHTVFVILLNQGHKNQSVLYIDYKGWAIYFHNVVLQYFKSLGFIGCFTHWSAFFWI